MKVRRLLVFLLVSSALVMQACANTQTAVQTGVAQTLQISGLPERLGGLLALAAICDPGQLRPIRPAGSHPAADAHRYVHPHAFL